MPPVLRSSRLPREGSTATTRPKRRRSPANHRRKRRSKITRRRRTVVLPILEVPSDDRFAEIISTSCYSSTFPQELAAPRGILPLSVKRKPRSTRRMASSKKLSENYGAVPEPAHSGTSGVETASFEASSWIHEYMLNNKLNSEDFVKSSGQEIISAAKFRNSDVSYSEICEGSNSFKPESAYRLGQDSPENPSENWKENPEIHEKLIEACQDKAPEACISELTVQAEEEELPYDLACSEQFSCSDHENRGRDRHFSNPFETNRFSNCSLPSFSDFSPIFFVGSSGDEFSEGCCENVHSSACFLLFLEYKKEILKSGLDDQSSSISNDEINRLDDFRMFEDDEDEETYRKFRFRERKHSSRHDYFNRDASTEHGEVTCSQRSFLVNWIVQHCTACDLQWETIFLSVSLLDRFLCKGFFRSESRHQILGIACATLATRMEENQPLNSITNEEFQIGDSVYRRCEVVAMEWVIMDVLKYKCFSPTTLNFLWFYLKTAEADEELERHARELAIHSLSHHEMLYFWPSTVAAGSVVQACAAKSQRPAIARIFEAHVRTKEDLNELEDCIKLIRIRSTDEGSS